jgi:aminoglycoside phosphotransferase (APT) family kinase protein
MQMGRNNMHIDNKRLLSGLHESIDVLAALGDGQVARAHHSAATTILAELLRRENAQQIRRSYARGRELALALAQTMAKRGISAVTGQGLMAALPEHMSEMADNVAAHDLLLQLRAAMTRLVAESGYPEGNDSDIDKAVMTLFDWESESFKLPALPLRPERIAIDMNAVLEESTRKQGGILSNAEVVHCTPLHGGFGNSTTLFEIKDNNGNAWHLVSRAARQDIPLGDPARDIGGEFHLLRYLHKHGIAVAEPLWLENDTQTYGLRFLVSRQVSGRNFGTVVSSEPLGAAQIRSLAIELARIHRLPIDLGDTDVQRSNLDPENAKLPVAEAVSKYLDRWVGVWRSIDVDVGQHPQVEATLNWLRANRPQSDDVPVLVHGDYALHNILIDGDEIGGVLDWEMAHVGDRAEDISYLLSSIGQHVSQEEFMRYYIAAGGRRVSQFQLKYYEVMGYFKMLVVMLETQLRFQTLPHAGPEYCVLGINYIQLPTSCVAGAIRAAEAAR